MIRAKKVVTVLLVLSCTGAVLVLGTGKREQRERKLKAMETLRSEDWDDIKATHKELLAVRKHVIAELIGIIEERENRAKKRNTVRSAMFVLGEMRAVEAVESLVEHIHFPEDRRDGPVRISTEGSMRGLKGLRRRYPAVDALIKIGEPCLDAVIARIAAPHDWRQKRACLGLLRGLGRRRCIIYMLEKAVAQEKDPQKIENLQWAIEELTPKKKEAKEESAKAKP